MQNYFSYSKAVGVFKKQRARHLTMFLTGKLFINVGTSYSQISALRGKIEHTHYDSTINILTGNYSSVLGVSIVFFLFFFRCER